MKNRFLAPDCRLASLRILAPLLLLAAAPLARADDTDKTNAKNRTEQREAPAPGTKAGPAKKNEEDEEENEEEDEDEGAGEPPSDEERGEAKESFLKRVFTFSKGKKADAPDTAQLKQRVATLEGELAAARKDNRRMALEIEAAIEYVQTMGLKGKGKGGDDEDGEETNEEDEEAAVKNRLGKAVSATVRRQLGSLGVKGETLPGTKGAAQTNGKKKAATEQEGVLLLDDTPEASKARLELAYPKGIPGLEDDE